MEDVYVSVIFSRRGEVREREQTLFCAEVPPEVTSVSFSISAAGRHAGTQHTLRTNHLVHLVDEIACSATRACVLVRNSAEIAKIGRPSKNTREIAQNRREFHERGWIFYCFS